MFNFFRKKRELDFKEVVNQFEGVTDGAKRSFLHHLLQRMSWQELRYVEHLCRKNKRRINESASNK